MQNIRQLHRGENTMNETHTETQGKTTNSMDIQQESKEKILRVMTGALSVLSYPPAQSNS